MTEVAALRIRRSMRTLQEVEALAKTVGVWRGRRHDLDVDARGNPAGRHKTQIEVIATTIASIAAAMRTRHGETNALDDDAVFDELAVIDDSVIWLDRLFQFFAATFAQRENGQGDVLRAADEVIWSCYEPVMRAAGRRNVMPPPPLPFIAPELSPAAIVHNTPLPAPLQAPEDLGGHPVALLDKIPVPLLKLPPHVTRAPWTLVFAGHEAAHYLLSDLSLAGHFAAAVAAGGSADFGPEATWSDWSEEIAADFIALLLLGAASRDALLEELWGSAEAMDSPLDSYPPASVRLSVLDTAAAKLGITVTGSLADERHAPLVEFLRGPIPEFGTLENLCGFAPKKMVADVTFWEEAMRTQNEVDFQAFDAPRRAAAAAYFAWTRIAGAGGNVMAAMATLAVRACALIAASGPEGERDAIASPAVPSAGALTDLLMNDVRARRRRRATMVNDAV